MSAIYSMHDATNSSLQVAIGMVAVSGTVLFHSVAGGAIPAIVLTQNVAAIALTELQIERKNCNTLLSAFFVEVTANILLAPITALALSIILGVFSAEVFIALTLLSAAANLFILTFNYLSILPDFFSCQEIPQNWNTITHALDLYVTLHHPEDTEALKKAYLNKDLTALKAAIQETFPADPHKMPRFLNYISSLEELTRGVERLYANREMPQQMRAAIDTLNISYLSRILNAAERGLFVQ